ncbi:NAD(P)-binding domain-containing protein [Lentzea sp. BCCO 10_0798]|uniref:NAD(P)-binding domain-containing protein n=1 Tax=Lentzea kristufekii TaxID=3095430 RepID=A0ABU4TWX2_9PSEU|nr:NAD(P)-binding domain-containing protein [Lentzea sp. BCCO 10_0798]MDX8052712.1 NAD(P)-binding domain-containing protein [Lentzea sp. BCCO 10_0798]
MPTLGIIGSGNIGAAVARLAVAAGVPVVVSNSRGPESLAGLVAELGPLATAGTVGQAAEAGDLVVLSVPLTAHTAVPAAPLAGKTVLDTSNYYPFRDGRIAELDEGELTTSELVHRHFGTARLVKAFNNILAHHIPQLARPSGAADRTALPVAGDHAEANAAVATLIDRLGFDTVDAGPLAQSWRFEPEAAAYTRLYLADPSTPDERMLQAPGRAVPAAELRLALQTARRVSVVDRVF